MAVCIGVLRDLAPEEPVNDEEVHDGQRRSKDSHTKPHLFRKLCNYYLLPAEVLTPLSMRLALEQAGYYQPCE